MTIFPSDKAKQQGETCIEQDFKQASYLANCLRKLLQPLPLPAPSEKLDGAWFVSACSLVSAVDSFAFELLLPFAWPASRAFPVDCPASDFSVSDPCALLIRPGALAGLVNR